MRKIALALALVLGAAACTTDGTDTRVETAGLPSIRQDLAFWMPPEVPAAELLAVVREAAGPLLRRVEVFDVYAREGRASLALRLEFQAPDRTLTDEEVAERRERIVAAVAEHGGELRG